MATTNAQGKSSAAIEAERARLRRNQRNSRARKAAYVENLEKRWALCVQQGAQATAEMQREARRINTENRVLRTLLAEAGVASTTIDARIRQASSSELQSQAQNQPQTYTTSHPATPTPWLATASPSHTSTPRLTPADLTPQQTEDWQHPPVPRSRSSQASSAVAARLATPGVPGQSEWDVERWLEQLTQIKNDYRPAEVPTVDAFGRETFDYAAHAPGTEVHAFNFGWGAIGTFSMEPDSEPEGEGLGASEEDEEEEEEERSRGAEMGGAVR